MSTESPGDDPFRKLALAIGFLAVGTSALVAHANPATGYELSVYTMTPPLVWAGLLVALSVALAVVFVPTAGSHGSRPLALVLGGLVMAVFTGLPIIRGYRFYGHHDALTHLGWARAIADGTIVPFDLYYPGIHTTTVFVNAALGIPLSRAMLLVVFLAVLVFCVFVPLCVTTIVPERGAAATAAFVAFLLLPITTISMYMEAHAMSQAVLFSTVLVYLLTKYLRTDREAATLSAVGIAFAVASAGAVVYHPQLVAHVLVVFLGICLVQFLGRHLVRGGRIGEQTPLYGQTAFLGAVFLAWISNHGFVVDVVGFFLGSAMEFLLGTGGRAGDTVAMQGASLAAIGGSLTEIFFKLFFPQLVGTVLVGVLVVGVWRRWPRFDGVRPETAYFVVGLCGLGVLFVVYFVAPGSMMHFRVFGLVMVFVTILGAVAVHRLAAGTSHTPDGSVARAGHPALAVGFALLVLLSLAAVFPSPYTYNASPHVTDQQLHGYETAFDSGNEEYRFLGLRNGPNRNHDAIHGTEDRMRLHGDLSDEAIADGLAGQYDEDRYLALTRADYERELIAYRGLRYGDHDFESIRTQPGVDRIQSNGEFELYYVHADTAA
ncbi:hypothetical protein [Halopiger djelfimassiliensis]|uniref:hypothetical protein n=1 Tax=Halopiger djelfimassiliensis TaxID=1293047 RepID=UPI000677E1D4|nr:hypothetical protein [Halopiger djelfimassiliensis]